MLLRANASKSLDTNLSSSFNGVELQSSPHTYSKQCMHTFKIFVSLHSLSLTSHGSTEPKNIQHILKFSK